MYPLPFLIASLFLAGGAYAESPPSNESTASASGEQPSTDGIRVHVVKASNANGDLVFSPNSIQANPGDMVQWQFYPKNHSVVMAAFAQPCIPLQQADPANAANAFFSGFMPVASADPGARLTYTILVKDTKPIWYYCSQGKHCQAGMVGVINPPNSGEKTIEAFAANAKNAAENVSPTHSAPPASDTSPATAPATPPDTPPSTPSDTAPAAPPETPPETGSSPASNSTEGANATVSSSVPVTTTNFATSLKGAAGHSLISLVIAAVIASVVL